MSAAKQLYKQILWAGRDYPGGIDQVRSKAKPQFLAMKDEKDPQKIEAAMKKGEYILNEILAMNRFHKYRTLKKRYIDPPEWWQ